MLHVLARGGAIRHEREGSRVAAVICVTRDGLTLADCTLELVRRQRRKRLIESSGGRP